MEFDKQMNLSADLFDTLTTQHQFVTLAHEEDKIIVYEKGDLVYIYNFHHSNSQEAYKIGVNLDEDHFLLFDTDEKRFGGHDRLRPAKGVRF